MFVEFPKFIAKGSVPISGFVVPFVDKFHGDSVFAKSPDFFDESIVEFLRPLSREEFDNLGSTLDEFGSVSPAAVLGVGKAYSVWFFRVPCVLGEPGFLGSCFESERR